MKVDCCCVETPPIYIKKKKILVVHVNVIPGKGNIFSNGQSKARYLKQSKSHIFAHIKYVGHMLHTLFHKLSHCYQFICQQKYISSRSASYCIKRATKGCRCESRQLFDSMCPSVGLSHSGCYSRAPATPAGRSG